MSDTQTPVAAPTEKVNQAEVDFFEEVVLPVVRKYGPDKGGRILTQVGEAAQRMHEWPDDIRESCMEELLRIISLCKQKAAKQSS